MTRFLKILLPAAVVLASVAAAEPMKVASLNPIVSDLARQVGGEDVEVIDLMPIGSDPHRFYPSPKDLKKASGAVLVLAAGKGLETYLEKFRESLGGKVPIFEVGDAVPSLKVDTSAVFVCCPAHHHALDPHWWHSVNNAKRAASAIGKRFASIDPEHAENYRQRDKEYRKELDGLRDWIRKEISRIPQPDRELTTAHAAFGYLCREYGLRSITVQGLTTEQTPDPGFLKTVVKTLKEHDVKAVFPEKNANPKVLASMVRETGVSIGGSLYAGFPPKDEPTYEAMMRHNIRTIVAGLRRKP